LKKAQSNLEILVGNIQALTKLGQAISRETNNIQLTTELNSICKTCTDKIRKIENDIPLIFKRNKNLLGYLQKIEDSLAQYQQWTNEAKQLMSKYSIQVPMKKIEEFLQHHRVR